MNKNIEQFIAYPNIKKTKKGSFFELALKSVGNVKRGKRKTTLSRDIDKILYGKK